MTRILGRYCGVLRTEVKGELDAVEVAVEAGVDLEAQGPVGAEVVGAQGVFDAPQLFPHLTMRWKMHCLETTLRRYARSARLNNVK